MSANYTTMSLADVAAALIATARDAQSEFGALGERQLNWRPDAANWSVAQCFDHLLNINREMFQAIAAATDGTHRRSVWQRLPLLPRVFGPMLIRSQMPESKRKFTAPRLAAPASSDIDPRIIERFVTAQHAAVERVRALAGHDPALTIVASPFISLITYSVLDGCRLIVAHERRHFEQAQRVTRQPGFPSPA